MKARNKDMKKTINIIDIRELINPTDEVDKRTTYLMTKNPDMTSIKDVEDGTELTITHVCTFEDTNKDGEMIEIQTYLADDGKVYATQSNTFKEYFEDIASIFDGEVVTIKKESGATNAGRPFVYCVLA